jgi:hypothetical protein
MSIERLREIDAIEDPAERLVARLNYHRETNVKARQLTINRDMLPDDVSDEEITMMAERIKAGAQVPEEWAQAVTWM